MGRRRLIHLAIDLAFHVQLFRGVFLHVVRVLHRIRQRGDHAYAFGDNVGRFADQAELVQLFQPFPDECESLVSRAGRGVV